MFKVNNLRRFEGKKRHLWGHKSGTRLHFSHKPKKMVGTTVIRDIISSSIYLQIPKQLPVFEDVFFHFLLNGLLLPSLPEICQAETSGYKTGPFCLCFSLKSDFSHRLSKGLVRHFCMCKQKEIPTIEIFLCAFLQCKCYVGLNVNGYRKMCTSNFNVKQ